MEFEVGATVGAYEIIDVISSSKTEIAYRVRNTQQHRIEVMRVLPLAMAGDQDATDRFTREMRVHAQLSHPNILVFFAAMQLERRLVMTTEFVDGVTLAEKLKSGPLPWKEAVALVSQALSALGHAHSQNVVHRDVTPGNIIITPEGKLKLTAFGLAKATGSPQLTRLGMIVGTLHYMSPEQVRGTSAVDARSDLYSLALVLYEAVAGTVPFDYRSQFDIMSAQVSETPKPPSTLNKSIPADLDALILKAAAKAPEDRFQSAEEFQAALEELGQAAQEAVSVPSATVAGDDAVEPAPAQPAQAAEPVPDAESAESVRAALPATAASEEMPGVVPAAAESALAEPVTGAAGQAARPGPVAPAAPVVEPAAAAGRPAMPAAPAAVVTLIRVPDLAPFAPGPVWARVAAMSAVLETLPVVAPAPAIPDAVPALAAAALADAAAAAAAVPVDDGSYGLPAATAEVAEAPPDLDEPPALPEAVPAAPAVSVPEEIPAAAAAAPAAPVELTIAEVEAVLREMASAAGVAVAVQNGTAHGGDALPVCTAGSSDAPEVSSSAVSPELESEPAVAVAAPIVVPAAAVEAPAAPNGTHTAAAAVPDAAPAPALLFEPPTVLALAPPPSVVVALLAPAEAPVTAVAADCEAPAEPAPAPLLYAEAPAVEEPPAAAPPWLSEAAEPFPDVPMEAAAAPQAPAVLSGAAPAPAPEIWPAEVPAAELVQIEDGDKPDEPSGFFADPRSPAWDGGRVLLYAATLSLLAVVIALVLTR